MPILNCDTYFMEQISDCCILYVRCIELFSKPSNQPINNDVANTTLYVLHYHTYCLDTGKGNAVWFVLHVQTLSPGVLILMEYYYILYSL
jgi:hypothetical protein